MKIKLKKIREQVVVIFGASSGIGRLTALEFAKKGACVAVAARSEAGLVSLVAEIEQAGGKAFYKTADAANFDEVQAVADQTYEIYGRIDSWVHCAATFLLAPFEQTTPEEFKRVIEVNLLGQVHGAMAALPFLKKNGKGALIHISSIEAVRSVPFQSAYGASKFGLKGFLQTLRVELQAQKIPIAVTEIMPGPINTPIWDKGRNKFKYKSHPPLLPVYHPQIVADAILFAAENNTRDLAVGGLACGVPISERISPRLNDFFVGLTGFNQFEQEIHPADAPDALFDTMPELSQIEGRFSDEQLNTDSMRWIQTRPPKVKKIIATLGGLVGGFLIYKFTQRHKNQR